MHVIIFYAVIQSYDRTCAVQCMYSVRDCYHISITFPNYIQFCMYGQVCRNIVCSYLFNKSSWEFIVKRKYFSILKNTKCSDYYMQYTNAFVQCTVHV